MSKLTDLKNANSPRTIDEWLEGFRDEDAKTVRHAILTNAPSRVYPILSQLEDNPFPFTKDSLSKWARK